MKVVFSRSKYSMARIGSKEPFFLSEYRDYNTDSIEAVVEINAPDETSIEFRFDEQSIRIAVKELKRWLRERVFKNE